MKITFEDGAHKVVWKLDQININEELDKLKSSDLTCISLEAEVETIKKCADQLRAALLTSVSAFGTEGVDPIRALIVLLHHYNYIDKTIDFNQVLQDQDSE
jgi:hypothetical protein